jgi:N-methylhydantoinase A
MKTKVCIDVGGTFTDAAVVDEEGNLGVYKSPTTPDDFSRGIIDVLKVAAEVRKQPLKEFMESCSSFIGGSLTHGSTLTTNAILEGKVAKVGLICTKGFRDTLLFREGYKENPFDFQVDYPEPFVPRYLTLPVTERINSEGGIDTPLNEDEVRQAVRQFKEWNVEAIAVSLIWSVANPIHEQRIKEIVHDEWPEVLCVLGSEVNPCIREYRRTVSCCVDAALKPLVTGYVASLTRELARIGYRGELGMLTSSGGVMSVDELVARPIYSIDCGPALAPVAGREFGKRELNISNVLTVDMGGTSFDVSVTTEGEIAVSREAKVGEELLGISKVDSRSVGAGGGSIAWVDPGGLIHVGPHSAGAVPGPASYGTGGEEPTVTDADLVLGYFDPDYFLGGRMKLDKRLAEKAVDKIAKKLNLGLVEAAFAIYSAVNANMYTAMENITIWQGVDPRGYLLVVGGGCAGAHSIPIADLLGVPRVLIPRVAGGLSAVGGTIADLVAEYSISHYTETKDGFDYDGVKRVLDTLKKWGTEFLDREGVPSERRVMELIVEARYPYQVWELPVPITDLGLTTKQGVAKMVERFHDAHYRVFAVKEPTAYLECIFWRIRAIGKGLSEVKFAEQEFAGEKPSSAALMGKRKAYFEKLRGITETPIYRGSELRYGNKLIGPVIIEDETSTTVVPLKKKISVTKLGSYLIEGI